MVHDFKLFPELTNRQMLFYYNDSPHKQITENFSAKVVKVTDGDTIRVRWEERDFDFPIRFIDTAAPELDEEGGIEAQKWLSSLILGEEVDIVVDRKLRVGKWGRLIAKVFHEGINLSEASIREGHALRWEDRKSRSLPEIPDFDKQMEAIWD